MFRKDRPKNKNARNSFGGRAVLINEAMRHTYKFALLQIATLFGCI